MVDRQIPLEVCPTSNLRTGVAPSWPEHPVGTLLAAGAAVTISTDDPTMFHCDLAGELRTVAHHFGDASIAQRLTANAVDASWLDAADKAELGERVRSWWRHEG